MDHAEARDLIELAALEAGGLDRLMAGDTPESAALAGHLVQCEPCATELESMRRTAQALHMVAEETPSPELREQTLSYIAAVGRPRERSTARLAVPAARRRFGLVALAAAAVFAVFAAGAFVTADLQGQADRARQESASLHQLYGNVEALLERPTTRLVALRTVAGATEGALVVDAASNRIAVLTDSLPAPGAGMEYRCWVEVGGTRRPIGRMWFEGGLAYWTGTGESVASWPTGAGFGISLEPVGQPGSAPAVLYGEL